jgi:H+-translocating NAD(P) transhydrogenase
MLDMFRRKTDAPEHNYLYGITGATFLTSVLAAHAYGIPHIYTMGYLASSICCIVIKPKLKKIILKRF